jgi:DNA processing protein
LTALVLVANCCPLVTIAIRVVLPEQAEYPPRLLALGWRPTLHVRGTLQAPPAARSLAIVGARAASGPSMERAHAVARHAGAAGVHVVSGGALGIDGAAHRGCIEAGGTTTVVLGSGADVLYPSRHASLFQHILDADAGALVSLLPDGTQPRAGTFVQRNPLISALADIVVVIEADVRSGSMSTAAAARKQGRLVAAWPGSGGCDRLIARGAAIVESADDVLAALAGAPRYPVPVELDGDAAKVRDALLAGARGIDQIVRMTGLPVRAVLRALPQLESPPARMQ